jgi:diguanylate cyclase (GGDEF)-like protein
MATEAPRAAQDVSGAGIDPVLSDVHRLGEALHSRSDEVVARTIEETVGSGEHLDPPIQASFEQIARNSTFAVSRWIAGDDVKVTFASAEETSRVFGEVAARRSASLQEVLRRSLVWRNVMAAVLRDCAELQETHPDALTRALTTLQFALEATTLRICEVFETERRRTDDALARREGELAFLATHDPLTGLPNRTLILDRLEQMLARATRTRAPVTALFIDLDGFKSINDTLGHRAGDQLLQGVATRLQGVVRGGDAVGRLGGDEFVVIAEELARGDGAELLAQRLLAALQRPFALGEDGEISLTVTASIGAASGNQRPAEELLRDADIAMYRAKREGRNRYALFEVGMQHRMQDRLELEMALRGALAAEQFTLVYQPTMRLADMRPTGVEALLRWEHPDRGTISPATFIPLLEDSGLIAEVGRWVLEQACEQAAAWRAQGHDLSMAVNVSGRQLDSDRLVDDVRAVLTRSGLPPQALTIEITETTLMRSVEDTSARLAAIRKLGVRIAIDDFGTGYSSLAHLKRFAVDALKIDRSFVSGVSGNRDARTLIHAVVQLGHALAIETVAEGIENYDELSLLRDEQCDSGQGFLFARPLQALEIPGFLAQPVT